MIIKIIEQITLLVTLSILGFATFDLIKHLPHHKMCQNDFIAIINGYKIISIIMFAIWIGITGLWSPEFMPITSTIGKSHPALPVLSPTMIVIAKSIWYIIGVYLLGLWISNIYVKYKRAKEVGFSGWKIVLSMPFCFVMTWMHGYLTTDSKQQTHLIIKSKWYERLNKWVLSNQNNTVFMFLVLFVFTKMLFFKQYETSLFLLLLFAIYMVWKKIAQKNFTKQTNGWYIWTGIITNLVMSILSIRMMIMLYNSIIM